MSFDSEGSESSLGTEDPHRKLTTELIYMPTSLRPLDADKELD